MLTHYIIVRRDLPLGVVTAMVTHAAGESAALYQDAYDGRFRGARAVVLEAKNEDNLYRIKDQLQKHGIQYVEVVESSSVYNGQMLAIGLVPIESGAACHDGALVGEVMEHFLTLKELDKPVTPNYNGHIDSDCEVYRGVGWMCTCETPEEKAERKAEFDKDDDPA